MRFGAFGDIHGGFDETRRIIQQHPDVPFWVCVGDVADEAGRYEPLGAPLYWIKGNNENFDAIASGDLPAGLHYIPNGSLVTIGGVRIAALGGTYAPTMYEVAPAELPHPTKRTPKATGAADRRRHFVREEVAACSNMRDVDILLTHEAPRPFRVKGIDAGKTPINDVLAAMQPRLHLFGHHHTFVESRVQGVRSVCLDRVPRSYLLLEPATLTYQVESSSL
ncbi:MAG: metallophosphoesterase [Acidobacteriota bacterium]